MTEQEYKELREKPEIPMRIWYEFFLEKGGFQMGLDKFKEIFTNMLMGTYIVTPKGPKLVSLETALRTFYQYYNKKFSL